MRTFQTRLHLTEDDSALLDAYGRRFAQVEHALFVDLQEKGISINALKREYLLRFDITARQFNSLRTAVEGKIQSLKQIQKRRIADIEERLTRLQKRLKSKSSCYRHLLHQKKQRMEARLANLLKDQKTGIVRMCFGSRKLFHAQHHLEENGFVSHEAWRQEWREKRSSSIFLLGSKDETAGNQSCVASIENDGTLSLRLRLPNDYTQKHVTIKNVKFKYGQDSLLQALRENQARRSLQKEGLAHYKKRGIAITYRFFKDRKGWRVFASVALPTTVIVTNKELGIIGVDLNQDHLALTATDRFGNPVSSERLSLSLYGKSKGQANALIGDVAKALVDRAKKEKKPIALEKLDFQNKRRRLGEENPKRARQLSAFAYHRTLEAIKARASREGVEVFEVNPAFTSQIGKIKFAKRYGLSIHHAAALCIARRVLGFSELLPRRSDVPSGKGTYVAFAVPARNRQRSNWSYLVGVTRKLQAALVEHFRETKCQSVGPPGSNVDGEPQKLLVKSLHANR